MAGSTQSRFNSMKAVCRSLARACVQAPGVAGAAASPAASSAKNAHVPLKRLDGFLQHEEHDEFERQPAPTGEVGRPRAMARAKLGVAQLATQRCEQGRHRRGHRYVHEVPASRPPGQPCRSRSAIRRWRNALIQWQWGDAP